MGSGSAVLLLCCDGLLAQTPELLSERLVLLIETLNIGLRAGCPHGSRTAFLDSLAEVCSGVESQSLMHRTSSSTT